MDLLKFFTILAVLPFQWGLGQEDQFDVMNITNVPFPSSSLVGATINVTQNQEISEFTVCHRYQFYWHERAAFQRSSFGRSRSGGRLLAMT